MIVNCVVKYFNLFFFKYCEIDCWNIKWWLKDYINKMILNFFNIDIYNYEIILMIFNKN